MICQGSVNQEFGYNFDMVTNRHQIISLIKANKAEIERYQVKSLALFGSAARDSLREDSDLDILVQFTRPTWKNYIGLKLYLEDLLGRDVDLVTQKALRPLIQPFVEKDLLHVVP
jgi:predicted nucleotidyltransferase